MGCWLLRWLAHQHIGWHDHGGTEGAFVGVHGNFDEQRARVSPDSPPRIEPFAPTHTFADQHIHILNNIGRYACISTHGKFRIRTYLVASSTSAWHQQSSSREAVQLSRRHLVP